MKMKHVQGATLYYSALGTIFSVQAELQPLKLAKLVNRLNSLNPPSLIIGPLMSLVLAGHGSEHATY